MGADIEIMLDANAGYDPTSAIVVGRAAERLGVYWLEEPILADDLPGYAHACAAPSMTSASRRARENSPARGSGLSSNRACWTVAQPDIARAGGFTGCRRIAALADAYNIAVCPHTGASGPICIAASMHLSAAIPRFQYFEDMYIRNLLHDMLARPLPAQRDSMITLSDEPGLGLALDEDKLRGFSRDGMGWQDVAK